MRIFNNNKNIKTAEASGNILLAGCFWVSAFTTTVTMSSIVAELLLPYINKVVDVDATTLNGICFIASLYFFYRVEAFIGDSAHVFFTELAGLLSSWAGSFMPYSNIRKVSLGLWGAVFVATAGFSAITSLSGAQKGSAAIMVNTQTDNFEDIPARRAKAIEQATKAQRETVEALKKERDAAIAKAEASLDKGTLRAARKGDALAKKEVQLAGAIAAKGYTAKIDKAQAELDKQVQAAGKAQDGIDELSKKKAELQLRGVEEKSTSLSWLARLAGLAPLCIGVAIKGTRAMSEVASAQNSPTGQAYTADPHQGQQAAQTAYYAPPAKTNYKKAKKKGSGNSNPFA